jgi:hypothetical protein
MRLIEIKTILTTESTNRKILVKIKTGPSLYHFQSSDGTESVLLTEYCGSSTRK